MKKYYLLLVFLTTNIINAQIFQDTKGELSVTGSGTASYKVPIALPPGIKDVAPQLALVYNGSSVQGMAGMGWNMVGISSITRTSSRIDLDGTIDPVDFDDLDRFALDGQRLIEKVGVYGASGTTYQTENYSNLKIESDGNFVYTGLTNPSGPQSFTLTFPDGSQAFYGGTADSRGLMEWMINRWIDPQGNYIDYTYETENNAIRIAQISWGKNTNSTSTYENLILFTYKDRIRAEFAYLNGIKIATTKILSFVTVKTGETTFRKYTLVHENLPSKYQRLKSITESNELAEKANPIVFEYDTDPDTTNESFGEFQYYNSPSGALLNDVKLSGDFDGDGQQDFVTKDKVYLNPIGNNNTWTGLDFNLGDSKSFTATTLKASYGILEPTTPKYTLNQFQSIVKVEESLNSISFNTYNLYSQTPYLQGVYLDKTKTIDFDNSVYHDSSLDIRNTRFGNLTSIVSKKCDQPTISKPTYMEGDFNGDGVSEVLIKSNINRRYYYVVNTVINNPDISYPTDDPRPPPSSRSSCQIYYKNDENYNFHLLSLVPNASTELGSIGFLKLQNDDALQGVKQYVADFNGDGKSDILTIKSDKTYKIVSFKQLKVAPWVVIEVLASGTFAEFDKDKQLVLGDFNGDSKTDIMIPEADASSNWFFYQATGTGFEKISYPNFVLYQPFSKRNGINYFPFYPQENYQTYKTYRAADLNKDGKSDFVFNIYETRCVDFSSNGCDRDATAIMGYRQNIGSTATQPVFAAKINSPTVYSDYGYDKGVDLLIGDYKNHQANFNFAFIQGTQIWKGNFNKDLSRDATLVKVTEAVGAITQTISYKPLVPSSGLETADDVYYSSDRGNSPTLIEGYPYTELIKAPTMNVVDKITVTGAGQTKSQLFKYFGLVTHAQGYGVLGFRKMARSSWYTDANPNKIWSCSQMNPQLLGQKIYEWSYSGEDHLANFRSFSIANPQAAVLGITKNTYTTSFLANGVKIIVPFTSEKKDFLTGLTDKTEFFYDTYWNISRTLYTNAVGTKENSNLVYDNPDGAGKLYALGRIVQTNQTLTAYSDTFTTEEKFTYDTTATNLVQQSQKKGHNTYYITTDYVYDVFGNVTEKTIAAPGVVSRTIKDTYDINGRFVLEKTDHELFVTKFTYNKIGQVLTSTSPLAVINTTTYDKWGKITKNVVKGTSTTVLTTTMAYTRFVDGGFSVTTTNTNSNELSRSFQDVFGRTTKSTTKGFGVDSWISKSTEYDFLGRKTRESEPYFDSNPTLAKSSGTKWNTVDYDYLSRPIGQLSYNGRTQTIRYEGLSTTTIDGPKTVKVTVDANGNKTELLDNSETLSYTYYANGTPKETLYGNHSITTQFDGWGRKTYMFDPSVSATPYTNTYTNFGEMLTETTPTGVTTFSYSPTGKLTKKTSVGQNSNVESNYIYNTKGLLTSEIGTNNGKAFSYTYTFNNLWQLTSKTEIAPDDLTHIKSFTYDSQGRILTETSNSYYTLYTDINNGKKAIQYGYNAYNGILEKFTDVASNVILWKLNTANEKMQVLLASLGNGMQINNAYDANDYVKTINHNNGTNTALNLEYQFKGDRGTLDYRKNTIDGVLSWNETFGYDSFERLTSWTDPTVTAANSYETDGRIKTNDVVGTYNYDANNRYRKESASLNTKGFNLYETRSPQTVTYNMFKNPTAVIEATRGRVNFEFNLGNSRSKSVVLDESGTITKNKYYSGVSTVEVIEKPGKSIQFINYIGGSPYDAVVAFEKTYSVNRKYFEPISEEFLYLHRDYQGTILAISGNGGIIKERRQFDPWGVLKKYYKNEVEIDPSTFSNVDFEFLTDRGYTGHEHFFSVGIIHMNGRIYDPVLRTFLSADPYIQDASNSQNYNRYAYCWNNPLMYTDPSGEVIPLIVSAIIIGAVIGGTAYAAISLSNGTFSWGGLAKSIIVGAVSGAATSGIGTLAQGIKVGSDALSIGSQLLRQGVSAVLHGVAQGVIQGVSGGDVRQSFLTAAISSVAAGAFGFDGNGASKGLGWANSVRGGDVGQLLFGTIAGGVTSDLQGGNFWEGAVIGFTVSALNHAMHQMEQKQSLDAIAKEKFGADYKTKYGVKSLKWGSQMPKKGIVTSDGLAKYNTKSEMITVGSSEAGGFSFNRTTYISDGVASYGSAFLEATIGHEFIHDYHNKIFNGNYNHGSSEYAAYQYTVDFMKCNNFQTGGYNQILQQYKGYSNDRYHYGNIPGFKIP